MTSIPPDNRDLTWQRLERQIQDHAPTKDATFRLEGSWKRFVREQDGFRVHAVNGAWVRSNLSVTFNHGGHGLVHEFIPHDEIWISTDHHPEPPACGCKISYEGQPVTEAYFESTVRHEIFEFQGMEKGMEYWEAHNLALQAETDPQFIADPDDDRLRTVGHDGTDSRTNG